MLSEQFFCVFNFTDGWMGWDGMGGRDGNDLCSLSPEGSLREQNPYGVH